MCPNIGHQHLEPAGLSVTVLTSLVKWQTVLSRCLPNLITIDSISRFMCVIFKWPHVVACCPPGTKPLNEGWFSYNYLSVTSYPKRKHYHWTRCIWKCRLEISGNSVSVPVVMGVFNKSQFAVIRFLGIKWLYFCTEHDKTVCMSYATFVAIGALIFAWDQSINLHRFCDAIEKTTLRKCAPDTRTAFKQWSLQWQHNGHDGVSNHQPRDCLLNGLFRRKSKQPSKFRFTGLRQGNSLVTGEFPVQRTSNAEKVSISWRHHVQLNDVLSPLRCQTSIWTIAGLLLTHLPPLDKMGAISQTMFSDAFLWMKILIKISLKFVP